MAKTRLQAKYDEPVSEEPMMHVDPKVVGVPQKRKERYSGAVDCLTQVYREKGIGGWYQVRLLLPSHGPSHER